ncbi:hypothetical protein HDR61_05520 [bacterium]|nr:hypothetical protein [bacterium]MBD5401166.1 hypothetical protein [bacterium]
MKSILKIAILMSLAMAAIYLTFCQPVNNAPLSQWCRSMILSKATGAFLFFALGRLYSNWKNDPWILRYENWSMKGSQQNSLSQKKNKTIFKATGPVTSREAARPA